MTLVAVPPFMLWDWAIIGGGGNSTSVLDAANEKYAIIMQAPKAGTIDKFMFRTGTVTTGETLDVRVETVAADGSPSGSLWAANTNAAVVVANADDNVAKEATFTAGAVVAKGDWFAIVLAMPGVTSGNMQITRSINSGFMSAPYAMHFTASWARLTSWPYGAVHYTDGWASIPGLFTAGGGTGAFASSTNPDERGNKITVPFACKVSGIWKADTTNDGDYTLKVYDSANNVLSDINIDGNFHADANSPPMYLWLDNELTLAAGDVVRVTLLATTATNVGIADISCPSGLAAALPGGGNVVGTTRNDAGAWTDTAETNYLLGLIISALDDGAGGSAGGGATRRVWGRGGQH